MITVEQQYALQKRWLKMSKASKMLMELHLLVDSHSADFWSVWQRHYYVELEVYPFNQVKNIWSSWRWTRLMRATDPATRQYMLDMGKADQ